MADPISLTAAAAGFIGLAGQLAQGVIKIREIYTTINDAPRDIENLCSKMAALQEPHDSSKISESLRDLKNQLHLHHNDGSAKVMLAQIGDIQRDIQASNRHLEQLVSRRSEDFHLNSARTTKQIKVGFQSMLFNFSVEISSETESQDAKGKAVAKHITETVCTIRLPNWFVQDQYNLAIARSKNGWLFHPVMYRTVELDSPLFKACGKGDLKTIKMLLTTKQAYLGDRHISGYSALDLAYDSAQLEACNLLVNAGILNFLQFPDYRRALESVALSLTAYTADRTKGREFLQLIEPERNLGAGWLDDLQLDGFIHKIVGDLCSYAAEIGGSDLDRFEALMLPSIYGYGHGDPEFNLQMVSDFLGDADHVHAIRAAAAESSWLLWVIAQNLCELFAYYVDEDDPCEEAIRAGCFALKVMCDSGLDLHAPHGSLPGVWEKELTPLWLMSPDFHYGTPLTLIVAETLNSYYAKGRIPRVLNQVLNQWATTLHDAGVDLAAYAEYEAWAVNRTLKRLQWTYNITCRLLHGSEPGDWRIEMGPPGEPYPANFWRGIEAAPIEEDLAAKVLNLKIQVEDPYAVHCEAPGGWQVHRHALEQPSWNAVGWLAYMDDDGLAKIETDLERLGAEEFYEVWDLSSVVEKWPCIKVRYP
ncbi:hypothetical protein MBLNU13_g04475t2 [Cladosporium sp. NU13]